MFRLLALRYAPKLVKTKKQASYMLQKNDTQEQELSLDEAIKKKQDQSYMEEAYNPTNVEKHWNTWWEQK